MTTRPGRSRTVAAALGVLGVSAVLAAGAYLGLTGDDDVTARPSPGTTPSTTSTTGRAPGTPGPTTAVAPTSVPRPTGTRPSATVRPPVGWVAEPWERPGNDFGLLHSARLTTDGRVQVVVDRASWLTGDAYDVWVAEHGRPENDYVVVNVSPRLRTWTLSAAAPLSGSILLAPGGGSGHSSITPAQLCDAMATWEQTTTTVPVWLFHASADLASPVLALQEQYVP